MGEMGRMETEKAEIYWFETEGGRAYFQVREDGTITGKGGKARMPMEKFHDFLATARILGLKTGKI